MSPTLNRQNSIRFYQILAVISESESTWNELSDGYTHGTQKFEHKIATLASFVMVHENCTEKHRILITQGFSSQTELDPWLSYHHKGNCKVSWNSNRGIWRKGLMPWFTKPTIAAALLGSRWHVWNFTRCEKCRGSWYVTMMSCRWTHRRSGQKLWCSNLWCSNLWCSLNLQS